MSSIPSRGIGVREKILAAPSVGVGGKTYVSRYRRTDWASNSKKSKKLLGTPNCPEKKKTFFLTYFIISKRCNAMTDLIKDTQVINKDFLFTNKVAYLIRHLPKNGLTFNHSDI